MLEIGCGTARNLTLAAKAYPQAQFFGIDVSEQMLTTARQSIRKQGLADRITVACGDAANFDPVALFGTATFDRVFISYALSMIPPWREALNHGLGFVAPSGSLHIVDFGDFGELPTWFGVGVNKWLGAFSVTPRLDLETELELATARRAMTHRIIKSFRGYAIHAVVVAKGTREGDGEHGIGARVGTQSPDRGADLAGYGGGQRAARA